MTPVGSTAVWYAMRASGVVAFLLLTTLVVLGLVLSTKTRPKGWPAFAVEDIHRYVGLLAGAFVALHVSLVVVDSFMPFSLTDVVVPFRAAYRPFWTGLGTVALALLAAVALTTRLRGRIPRRVWRATHGLGFAVWALAAAHGLGAGTDRRDLWLLPCYILAVTAVGSGIVARIAGDRSRWLGSLAPVALCATAVVGLLAVLPVEP